MRSAEFPFQIRKSRTRIVEPRAAANGGAECVTYSMAQAPIRGILFDSDGTLVDTERISTEVLCDVLTEHGIPANPESAVERWSGRDLNELLRSLQVESRVELPDDFLDRFRAQQHVRLEQEVLPIEGADQVLGALALPRCVASNAPVYKVELCLRTAGLLHHFDEGRIFSAYEVGAWKPAPDLFLHAAHSMQLSPSECVVVEDSEPGVAAALAAGMRVLALDPLGRIPSRPGMVRIGALVEVLEQMEAGALG